MNIYNNTAKSEIRSMVTCKRVNNWEKHKISFYDENFFYF